MLRLPYPWGREDTDLIEFYKKIGKVRINEPIYKNGLFEIIECNSDFLAFARYNENEFVVTIVNRGNEKYHLDANVELKSIETGRAIKVFNPGNSYILKGKADFTKSKIEFFK